LPVQWGAYVSRVASGSPANSAGLQRGDIIVQVGDVAIDDTHSYLNTLYTYEPGDQVVLTIVRQGADLELQVTLGESSPSS
jgi:S1-C subfamily serine protease